MTIGTARRTAARRYYRDYEGSSRAAQLAVHRKLAEGQIFIGPPVLRDGERLVTIDGGTRYAILEGKL